MPRAKKEKREAEATQRLMDPIAKATSRDEILDNRRQYDPAEDSRTNAVGRKRKFATDAGVMTLADIEPLPLRDIIQHHVERDGLTIEGALRYYTAAGRPFRRFAQEIVNHWVPSASTVDQEESDSDEISVGDEPPGESDRDDGELPSDTPADADVAGVEMVRLADISEAEQKLQYRCFMLANPRAYVMCMSCGLKGHMQDACPAKTCKHCGAVGEHFAGACPINRKCGRCRKRGHMTGTCTNRTVQGGGAGDPCDVCGQTGHVEEECSGLWRTNKVDANTAKKIPATKMIKACYNCGSSSHWGDDCPHLPAYVLRKAGGKGTWSAENANKYIEDDGIEDRGHGGRAAIYHPQAYQLAQFDD